MRNSQAFSLVELLVVMALIGILAVLAIPAFNAIGGGHAVTREGQVLNDQINLARQIAITRNRETELRLIAYPGPEGESWALQIFEAESGAPLHRLVKLADNVVISRASDLSPLLDILDSSTAAYPQLGSGTCAYQAVTFRPNGRVKGSYPVRQDFLTLHLRRDSSATPVNYFTLQIQPLTGRLSTFRP